MKERFVNLSTPQPLNLFNHERYEKHESHSNYSNYSNHSNLFSYCVTGR